MGNTFILFIGFTYESTSSPLKAILVDKDNIKKLIDFYNDKLETSIKYRFLVNMDKISLQKKLSEYQERKICQEKDSIMIIYSGHGYFDANNNIAGGYYNDNQSFLFTDLTKYFTDFSKLYFFVDGCQNFDKKANHINFNQISNKYSLLVYPVSPNNVALCDNIKGSYFLRAIIKNFKLFSYLIKNKMFTTKNLLKILFFSFGDYILKHSGKFKPKIYVNHQMRLYYQDEIQGILNFTEQKYKEIFVTKINCIAINNKRIYKGITNNSAYYYEHIKKILKNICSSLEISNQEIFLDYLFYYIFFSLLTSYIKKKQITQFFFNKLYGNDGEIINLKYKHKKKLYLYVKPLILSIVIDKINRTIINDLSFEESYFKLYNYIAKWDKLNKDNINYKFPFVYKFKSV